MQKKFKIRITSSEALMYLFQHVATVNVNQGYRYGADSLVLYHI